MTIYQVYLNKIHVQEVKVVNIEQLKYIVEVTKTRSISTAAENLYISQSTISKAITNLEQELKITLFKRTRLGTEPTAEGKSIIRKAYEIENKLQEIYEEAKLQLSIMDGELNISASPSLFMSILLGVLSNFKKDYPNIRIVMTEKKSPEVIEDVLQGRIDLGLAMIDGIDLGSHEELTVETLLNGRVMVCVSKNSPLSFSDSLTPEEIINETFVLYDGGRWKEFTPRFMNRSGSMNILFSSNNTEVIKKAVAEGLAISFLMDIALRNDHYIKSGEIVAIPLVGFESNPTFGLVRSKKMHFPLAANEFLKYLKIYISKLE
jgi:LysR family transcriptional regulator, transcription activator of glutamate synthase operon